MHISEIPKGSSVNLLVKNKAGASAILPATAVEGMRTGGKHILLITCVKKDGKVISFEGFSVTAQIHPKGDDRDYSYLISGIALTKKNGVSCHALYSNDNATPKERRDSVRVALDEPAQVKIDNRPPITVTAKDISISGIAFIIPSNVSAKLGDPVEANFTCSQMGATYQVSSTVARIEKQPDGQIVIGCRLSTFNKSIISLVTFLARKQGIAIPSLL